MLPKERTETTGVETRARANSLFTLVPSNWEGLVQEILPLLTEKLWEISVNSVVVNIGTHWPFLHEMLGYLLR